MLKEIIQGWQLRLRRRKYQPGKTFTQFVAKDIRREIEVVDATDVDDGFIVAKCRTWNLLYAAKGIEPKPDFAEPKRLNIKTLWDWTGQSWGGPVPKEEA